MIVKVADHGLEVVHEALDRAQLAPDAVDFYASHQATPWFRRVTQKYAGLEAARYSDTFEWTGHVSACNVPLSLVSGEREGLLKDGDVVATYAGGTGLTWSSTIIRWGRG
jgi:3-oxoacyl-[acyl-carrier-protein] synthase-3